MVQVATIRFEHHREPVGIGESRPRLSWKVVTEVESWAQTAYEIEMVDDAGATWSSGRVESSESVLVAWQARPLRSRECRRVRVRVWGNDGNGPSTWSADSSVEAGLLETTDWTADLIAPDWDPEPVGDGPAPLLRRTFDLHPGVARARLYVTAHGLYEMELNGTRVGDHVLAPGWTSYHRRLRYQTFDVTALVTPGANVIGAMLGDGWFRGRIGFEGGRRNVYGDHVGLLAQVAVDYVDGTSTMVRSDSKWRFAAGPIVASGLYDGETYDARLERRGWSTVGYDDSDWTCVRTLSHDVGRLVAPTGPPVRRIERLAPYSITASPRGNTIVDFGQNIVGRVSIRVRGETGRHIHLRHAEVLEDGEICLRPLRHARAADCYILSGEGLETWEPRFTFHGFRYVEVSGWPGELRTSDLHAVVCHTDMERTGWFESSEPMLDRLHENAMWSMRGNFVDVPTDCPQRDERLGWTGDVQVFAPAATYLYDCIGTVSSWLSDLACEQEDDGIVPAYVPYFDLGRPREPAAAWGDAAVIVPWVLYQRSGDLGLLRRQYDSMRAWVEVVERAIGDRHLWDHGFQFGDWLDPAAPPEDPAAAKTDRYLVATAYAARSAELLGEIATLLDDPAAGQRYHRLAAHVRRAFSAEYVAPSGLTSSDSQTAYALALQFGLLASSTQRRSAARRLADLVRAGQHRIETGFVGTPLLCDALCAEGHVDTAYKLLLQRECPSWLYPVTMGATSIWERWDSLLPDGRVNPGEMTSFNHYALGAVVDWMHRSVAGLAPAAPGYRKLLIRPRPGGGLRYVRTAHETPYGLASVRWERRDTMLHVDVVVPPSTSALFVPPGQQESVEVGSGRHAFVVPIPEFAEEDDTLTTTDSHP